MALSTKVSSAVRLVSRSRLALAGVRWQHDGMFANGPAGGGGGYGGGAPGGYGGGAPGGYGGGPPGGYGGGPPGGYGGGPPGGYGGGAPGGYGGGAYGRPPRPPMPEHPMPDVAPFRMFVRNLSYNAVEDDIRNFFSGLEILEIHIPKNEFGLSRGFAFVEFTDKSDAQKSMDEFNGRDMMGRSIGIRVASPRGPPRDPSMGQPSPRGDNDGF